MATYTSRLGLAKPSSTDIVDIGILDNNFDIIDSDVQVGRFSSKDIPANTNACRIDLPAGAWFMILSTPGISRTWVGLVYCSSGGSVDIQQINSSTGMTVTAGTERINCSFTVTQNTTFCMTAIPFRGVAFPEFH